MLLPEIKEREYRFRLALRMVLPIFALILAFIFDTFISSSESLNNSFYIEAILVLVFSIYFIFYLIYKGFDTKITDSVTKTFSRAYLYKYLNREMKNSKEYTLLLISIDNLEEINSRYGIKNGDKILNGIASWIGEYFKTKNIINFPLGHIKGGDFVIGLKGSKNEFKTILEIMSLKSDGFMIDDIEIQISGAINDKTLSDNINYLVENLFELQSENKNSKLVAMLDDEMNPSEAESLVVNAIKDENFIVMTQDVFESDKAIIEECFVKLKTSENKLIHQKTYMKILDKLRLMVDFDLMVAQKIIATCNKSIDEKYAISVAPTSIRNPMFLNKIKDMLSNNPEAKDKIVFILNESEYYPKIQKYNATLQVLRNIGINIALDRLGAIHTSFLYLRDLDIDIVRFDAYYTKEMQNSKSSSVISGFNEMAHQKNVKTWIKMLENEDVKTLANDLKIDYLQGKYLAELEEKV